MKWLSYRVLTAIGWRFEGQVPDLPKMVIIGAPHTSNWDFLLFLAALHYYRLKVRFLGKHTLFRWPLGYFFRRWGGIPVDRTKGGGVVAQVKQAFDEAEEMILVIAPEGTRKAAPRWKSGFVEIAERSDVPVVFAGVDGPGKTLVIGPAHRVGADRTGFMDRVRAFYNDKEGINPKGKGPVRIGTEDPVS